MQVFGHPNHIYKYVKKKALPTHSKRFSSSQGRNEMDWNGVGTEILYARPTRASDNKKSQEGGLDTCRI